MKYKNKLFIDKFSVDKIIKNLGLRVIVIHMIS